MKRSLFLTSVLCFGVAFLYVPIASMMVYSFNSSRLATVWGGFSTEWYGKLWENDQVWDALWLSLRIAAVSATLATVLDAARAAFDRADKARADKELAEIVTELETLARPQAAPTHHPRASAGSRGHDPRAAP